MIDKKKKKTSARDELIEVVADMSSITRLLIARASKGDEEMHSVMTQLFTILLSKISFLAIPDLTEDELAIALEINDMRLEFISQISDKFFEMKN